MGNAPEEEERQPQGTPNGITRRRLIAGAGATALAGGALGYTVRGEADEPTVPSDREVAFYGPHQAGIATPRQDHLLFATFDLSSDRLEDLRDLLRQWTLGAASLATAGDSRRAGEPQNDPPGDRGEAAGLGPASLTLTLGLGPALFERDGSDRLGLGRHQPSPLRPIPPFPGDALEEARSGGDLCIQACAEHPQVVFHAVHELARQAAGLATPRWTQTGFIARPTDGSRPRNLFGFRDGTNNLRLTDDAALQRHVWVPSSESATWMQGGSYLVARRIEMLFDVWDPTSLQGQERVFGRHKASGAPLGQHHENDPVDLRARSNERDGPVVAQDAHIRLAAPRTNDGRRLLRRSYSFVDTAEAGAGQLEAGLLFLCFQQDPFRQFVPIQRRLAESDALNKHTLHTGSAVFACPPGVRPGEYIGQELFRS